MKQLLLTGLLAFGLGHSAFGAVGLELELTDGTNTALINSSGTLVLTNSASGTASVSAGLYIFSGNVGNYNVNVSTGEGTPVLTIGSLDLNSVNTATVSPSGPLTIEWSENGITTAFPSWDMQWGGTLNPAGAGSTVSNTAYEDNSNAFFGTMHTIGTLGPFGPGAFSGMTTGGVAGVTTPYSLTEVITLNGVGATTYSGDASLTPVPEPAAVALLGAALLLCSSRLRRRKA